MLRWFRKSKTTESKAEGTAPRAEAPAPIAAAAPTPMAPVAAPMREPQPFQMPKARQAAGSVADVAPQSPSKPGRGASDVRAATRSIGIARPPKYRRPKLKPGMKGVELWRGRQRPVVIERVQGNGSQLVASPGAGQRGHLYKLQSDGVYRLSARRDASARHVRFEIDPT